MASAAQTDALVQVLNARAYAVQTATTTTIANALERLREAMTTAQRYVREGQGGITAAVWDDFARAVRRATAEYTSGLERQQSGAGLERATAEMSFTEDELYGQPRATTPRTTVASTPRTSTPRTTADEPDVSPLLAFTQGTSSGAPSGTPGPLVDGSSKGQGGGSPRTLVVPQGAFMALVNPQDRPLYLRPWFLGLAGVAGVTLVAGVISVASMPPRRSSREEE